MDGRSRVANVSIVDASISPSEDIRMKMKAVKLYSDGLNYQRIGRQLEVSHQTLINWVKTA